MSNNLILLIIAALAFSCKKDKEVCLPDMDKDPAPKLILAMQFQNDQFVGSQTSYAQHFSGLPLPEYTMIYGSVFTWHSNKEREKERLRESVQKSAEAGIHGLLYTLSGAYNAKLAEQVKNGDLEPLSVLLKRYWVSKEEPGFLGELEAQREVIRDLVNEGLIKSITLRPFQEAGQGIHVRSAFTPQTYKETIEWLVNELYAGLPVKNIIVHWNKIEDLALVIPRLTNPSIKVFSGVTISMPSNGGMSTVLLSKEDTTLLGLDIATRSWNEAGVDTWIAEFSVFDDGRKDKLTGWSATGLNDPSVIPEFFEHFRALRNLGHIGGITWLNKVGWTGLERSDPNLKDGRWDNDKRVDEKVRNWWIEELKR